MATPKSQKKKKSAPAKKAVRKAKTPKIKKKITKVPKKKLFKKLVKPSAKLKNLSKPLRQRVRLPPPERC